MLIQIHNKDTAHFNICTYELLCLANLNIYINIFFKCIYSFTLKMYIINIHIHILRNSIENLANY